MRLSDEVCSQAQSLIASRLGLDFPARRRPDLERGLIQAVGSPAERRIEQYLRRLADLPGDSPELMHLAQHLTVGETYFFRDRSCFAALEDRILPALIASRRKERVLQVRIWSAGCASGEEPYSVAMLLDRLLPDRADWALTILATDVNPEALEVARRARYREWSFREAPEWAVDRYFHREAGGGFDLDPDIRGMVTFQPLNLAAGGYPSALTNTAAMDLILCRNVLMYFTDAARRGAAARLQQALAAHGWLAVSPVEATPDVFRMLVPSAAESAGLFRRSDGVPLHDPLWGENTPIGAFSFRSLLAPPKGPTLAEPVPASGVPISATSVSLPRAAAPPLGALEDRPDSEAGSLDAGTVGLEEAVRLADQEDLEQARRLCEAARAENPLDPDVHLLLAMIAQEQGDLSVATDALRRVIYLEQDSARAHFLLGSLQIRQGNARPGRRSMQTVVSLLGALPSEEPLAGSDGVTTGRLREAARAHLEATDA